MAISPNTGYMIIKQDAFADGHVPGIEQLLVGHQGLDVVRGRVLTLGLPEILDIYRPDTPETVDNVGQALRSLGAVSMMGTNKILEIAMPQTPGWDDIVKELKAVRGSIKDDASSHTVRGTFPHPRSIDYATLSFWEQSVYFVRNRVHTPDTVEAAQVMLRLLEAEQ